VAPKHATPGPQATEFTTRTLAPEGTTSGPQRSEYSISRRDRLASNQSAEFPSHVEESSVRGHVQGPSQPEKPAPKCRSQLLPKTGKMRHMNPSRAVTIRALRPSETGYSDHCINGHYRYRGPSRRVD
jgi:hypothetical protein